MKALFRRFVADARGDAPVRTAVLFCAAAMAAAVLAAPLLEFAAERHARNGGFGVDRVVTGSVDANTYIVRRSVLSKEALTICGGKVSADCAVR